MWLLRILALVGALYGAGFLLFVLLLPSPRLQSDAAPRADAIVALTGQDGRLAGGVRLLERGAGARLLISGVNPSTSKDTLKALLNGGTAFDCCADLGTEALDTRGNARETAEWAVAHGYDSLIVVTGYEHMPRSLLEFSAAMPEMQLIPYPIWPQNESRSLVQRLPELHAEYGKYLASWARISLARGGES